MPAFLLNFLKKYTVKQHLFIAIVIGLIFRIIASINLYAPMSFDDYGHGILCAQRLFIKNILILPPYRSPLLPYLLTLPLKLFKLLGFTYEPVTSVIQTNLMLSLISMLAIIGGYYYVKSNSNKIFSSLLLYLLSIYAFMPFAATRTLGETVAIPFIMLGLGLCEYGRYSQKLNKFIIGLFFIGIAVMFRYQIGLIYVTYGLIILFDKQTRYKFFYAFIYVGLFILLIECLKDLYFGRTMLSTLINYFKENQKDYGKNAWYNHVLLVLALMFFPFSAVLFNKIKILFSKHKTVVILIIVFVIAHSFVPNKEERFMFPIIPLLLICIAVLWSENIKNKLSLYVFSTVFLLVNTVLLFVVNISNTQLSYIGPLVKANTTVQNGILANINFNKWAYDFYLNENISTVDLTKKVSINDVEELFLKNKNTENIMFITPNMNNIKDIINYNSKNYTCSNYTEYGSMIDRIIYKLNPEHNIRRKPTCSITCTKH